jgi:hypothetical protein
MVVHTEEVSIPHNEEDDGWRSKTFRRGLELWFRTVDRFTMVHDGAFGKHLMAAQMHDCDG